MEDRRADGSAGDADYGRIGPGYSRYRQPDPQIAACLHRALGPAVRVLNVGAGAGSYEPEGCAVTAVEPSAAMRAQRRPEAPAIDATAEALPFADHSFDAAMASFTVHQWRDLPRGLSELRRVTQGPVVILTCDPIAVPQTWLNDYAPEMIATEARRYPSMDALARGLGPVDILPVLIPLHCTDGFSEAYYGRPEALLDPDARKANSAWSFVGPEVEARFAARLGQDLTSGFWDWSWGHLRQQPYFEGSLRLVVSRSADS